MSCSRSTACAVYERKYRTRGQINVVDVFCGFHIVVFLLLVTDRPAAFLPHGIPVAALAHGRWVRGGEPDERVKNTNKPRIENSTPEERGALTQRPGQRC
jgi:hypothetical protein